MSDEKESKRKLCQCGIPTISQPPLAGFKGFIKCHNCGGDIEFPMLAPEYKGTDPVEGFIHELGRTTKAMTFEKAILMQLKRIEEAVLRLKK